MTDALTELGATAVRRWFEQGLRSMLALRRQVDVLNVFPVADGDTGTNIVLTLAGAARAANRLPADAGPAELTAAAARGALVGARGNSGVILSQAMRGLARAVAGRDTLDGAGLAQALTAAAEAARLAVDRPVEGTMLTVADAAAAAARAAVDASAPTDAAPARQTASLAEVVAAATEAAVAALADTRSQLPVLAERDVVDAGAAGYVILLEALAGVVDSVERPGSRHARESLAGLWATPRQPGAASSCAFGGVVVGEESAGAFEVMYVLHATGEDAAALRGRLTEVGTSVAVVGGADSPRELGLWQLHVHTDDPTAVLAHPAAMEQVGVRSLSAPARGVLACTRIAGLAAPLAATGAVVALHPDQPGLERGVVDAGAARVLVLTGDDDAAALATRTVATGARGLVPGGPTAEVVAAGSEVAVLAVAAELGPMPSPGAALPASPGAARPPSLDPDDAARIAARVRTGSCAVADLPATVAALVHPDAEVVTVVVGDVPVEAVSDALRSAVHAAAPLAEIVLLDGGQQEPELLLGVQ